MAGESRKDSNSRTFVAGLRGNAKLAWSIAPGEKLEIAYTECLAKWKGKTHF